MAFGQWWQFTEGLIELDHDSSGVYALANAAGTVIYVGSANEVRRRLKEHFNESNTCIKRNATKYCIDYRSDYKRQEQVVYDEIVRTTGKAPQCNSVRPACV